MAFMGICQIHFDPAAYLAIANPNVVYVSSMQPLLTSILGGWLVILLQRPGYSKGVLPECEALALGLCQRTSTE